MARHLLDTNLVLRLVDSSDPLHALAVAAAEKLIQAGHEPAIVPQVLIELWAVATRPTTANGLGWEPSKAERLVQTLQSRFTFLEDDHPVFGFWLNLASTYSVRGKQVHDTRIVAAMLSHGVTDLLTFNDADFRRFTFINVLTPAELMKAP